MFRPTLIDSDYIDALDAEGLLLLGIAEARIFDAAIPFCPGWALNELVTHLGYIYRWVTVIVGDARLHPPGRQECTQLEDPDPADYAGTLRRLRSAHTALVGVLRQAPPELALLDDLGCPLSPYLLGAPDAARNADSSCRRSECRCRSHKRRRRPGNIHCLRWRRRDDLRIRASVHQDASQPTTRDVGIHRNRYWPTVVGPDQFGCTAIRLRHISGSCRHRGKRALR